MDSTGAAHSKDIFVKDLQDKQVFSTLFLVRDKAILNGKNGKAYISLNLCDSSGTIDARVWDNVDQIAELFQDGDIVRVKGLVQIFQHRKQAIVHKVERVEMGVQGLDLGHFVTKARMQPEEMMAQLIHITEGLQNHHIKQLILDSVRDPEIRARLLLAPAAKTIHHAWVGGLLEHILSICGLMKGIQAHYKDQGLELNLDYLIFGAIFHDIGKIWELEASHETGLSFAYTDRGRLIGHMVMAVELVEKKASRILGFPDELKDILKHIILSHHGKMEYGSPKTPSFLEAFIVAAVDDFDSKVSTISQIMRVEGSSGDKWSRYSQLFERYFLLRV